MNFFKKTSVRLLLVLVVLGLIGFFIIQSLRPAATVTAVSRGPAVDAVPGVVTIIEESEITLTSEVSGRVLNSELFLGAKVGGPQTTNTTQTPSQSPPPSTSDATASNPTPTNTLSLQQLNSLEKRLTESSHTPEELEQYLQALETLYPRGTHDINEPLDLSFKPSPQGADLLIQIDPTDLEIGYEAFEIGYEAFKSDLLLDFSKINAREEQKEDLRNFSRQFKEGNLPGLDWRRSLRSYRLFMEGEQRSFNVETQTLASRRNEKKKRLRELAKTDIYAPVTGTVTEIYVWPGELVDSGSPIAKIISDALLIQADINEENFAGIRIGQKATIRFLSYGNQMFEGTVTRVLPTADADTQQYSVYLEINEGRDKLLPGLTGEVSIIKDKKSDTLIIPRRALLGPYVMVAEEGFARQKPVTVGYTDLVNAEILEGLEEGDLVITEQLDRFKDGDKIRLQEKK